MGYRVGNVIEMKKGHPCGSNKWEILMLASDVKLRCSGCGRIIIIPRSKFEKNVSMNS